jgi:hypothetical protein
MKKINTRFGEVEYDPENLLQGFSGVSYDGQYISCQDVIK